MDANPCIPELDVARHVLLCCEDERIGRVARFGYCLQAYSAHCCGWQGRKGVCRAHQRKLANMYNYVVTAHKPSAVHLSLTANFTGAKDKNLIVTKSNRLVIYLLTPECLQPILDTSVYGRIANIEVNFFAPFLFTQKRETGLMFGVRAWCCFHAFCFVVVVV